MVRIYAASLTSCLFMVSGGTHFASGSCAGECPTDDSGDSLLATGVLLNEHRAAVVEDISSMHELTAKLAASTGKRSEGAMKAVDMENVLRSLVTRSVEGKETVPQSTLNILSSVDTEMDKIISDAADFSKIHQRAVDRARDDITECNVDPANISGLTATVSAKRVAHTNCRAQHKTSQIDKVAKCDELESYRTNLQAPSCLTCESTGVTGFQDETMACMKEIGSWYAETNSTWGAKKGLCDAASSSHAVEKSTCDADQMGFEAAFCIYADALTLVCNGQSSCRSSKIGERTTIHADAGVAEASAKAETVAATKVNCFINVLRGNEDEQPDMLAKCVEHHPDTSALDIVYPEIPSATACDLSVVATKPCDNEWVTAEYENSDWYSEAPPKACTACAAAAT